MAVVCSPVAPIEVTKRCRGPLATLFLALCWARPMAVVDRVAVPRGAAVPLSYDADDADSPNCGRSVPKPSVQTDRGGRGPNAKQNRKAAAAAVAADLQVLARHRRREALVREAHRRRKKDRRRAQRKKRQPLSTALRSSPLVC